MDAEEGQQLLKEPLYHQATSGEGLQSAAVPSAASDNDLSSASVERPGDSGPLRPGLASIPEASILYRYTSVLVSVSVSANSIDTLVYTSY
jgi:hypothetical protein